MSHILHHEPVVAAGQTPRSWLWVLHGVYGSGRNWASLARHLVVRRPDWGVLLVDLRAHGRSPRCQPPHTIATTAADLAQLADSVGCQPRAVLGHSFGGKVALAFSAGQPVGLEQMWMIDATPRATEPNGQAWAVVSLLRRFPVVYEGRDQLVAMLQSEGLSQPMATWMAMNLQRVDNHFVWRICPDTIEALLTDYFATDLWSALEDAAGWGLTIRFVKALQSEVIGDCLSRQISDLDRSTGRVHLHPVSGGHMLNVDNPYDLVNLLSEHL